jgi:hypothetical protein
MVALAAEVPGRVTFWMPVTKLFVLIGSPEVPPVVLGGVPTSATKASSPPALLPWFALAVSRLVLVEEPARQVPAPGHFANGIVPVAKWSGNDAAGPARASGRRFACHVVPFGPCLPTCQVSRQRQTTVSPSVH